MTDKTLGKSEVLDLKKSAIDALNVNLKANYQVRQSRSNQVLGGVRLEVTPERVNSKGRLLPALKVFRYVKRIKNGKVVNVTLGRWGETLLSVDDVLDAYEKARAKALAGENPNEEGKLTRESASIADLFERYTSHFQLRIRAKERRQKSLDDVESLWRNHIATTLADKKSALFTFEDASSFMAELGKQQSYAIYNKCLRLLKAVFNHALTNKLVKSNPFDSIRRLHEEPRTRRLSLAEFDRLRIALADESQIYQDLVLTLIFTGQRKHCVFSMEWDEINRDQAIWTIPPSKNKSKKIHSVPLSDVVMQILERRSLEARQGDRFVFPSYRSQLGHVVEKSGAGSFWRRITMKAGLYDPDDKNKRLTIHDLRRSLASFSVERGGSLQAVSKLLGHSDVSITNKSYAFLLPSNVRDELQTTERLIMGSDSGRDLERLRDQILALSEGDRNLLISMVMGAK